MGDSNTSLRQRITSEVGLFVGLLFVGFVLMPIVIYYLGTAIFGEYGGAGYGDFFGTLSARVRAGDLIAWFLILSPYLAILIFRCMAWGWRQSAQA